MKLETVPIKDAKELVETCRLGSNLFAPQVNSYNGREWLFRGHADAKWSLVPKLYRSVRAFEDVREKYRAFSIKVKEMGSLGPAASLEQCERWGTVWSFLLWEDAAVRCFEFIADEAGLLPMADADERGTQLMYQGPKPIITDSVFGSVRAAHFAAQHHGLPTRLLDWTYRPEVALYFAFADWMRMWRLCGEGAPQTCAVFAFSTYGVSSFDGVQVLHPPRGANQYLRAQAGAFSVDLEIEERYVDTGRFAGFEQQRPRAAPGSSLSLVKIEFPGSIVNEAMRELRHRFPFIRSAVIPSLESVAIEAGEQASVRRLGKLVVSEMLAIRDDAKRLGVDLSND